MGISEAELLALKGCHEAGRHVCDHVNSRPASMAYVASHNERSEQSGPFSNEIECWGNSISQRNV